MVSLPNSTNARHLNTPRLRMASGLSDKANQAAGQAHSSIVSCLSCPNRWYSIPSV